MIVDSKMDVEVPSVAEVEDDPEIVEDSELPDTVTTTDDVWGNVVTVSLPLLGAKEVTVLDELGE